MFYNVDMRRRLSCIFRQTIFTKKRLNRFVWEVYQGVPCFSILIVWRSWKKRLFICVFRLYGIRKAIHIWTAQNNIAKTANSNCPNEEACITPCVFGHVIGPDGCPDCSNCTTSGVVESDILINGKRSVLAVNKKLLMPNFQRSNSGLGSQLWLEILLCCK